jgi:hypothetical protein
MSARLISYSRSADNKSLQDIVAYCARVSNPANQGNKETNEKLIRYLIKNQHWSPLEMVSICLEIETRDDEINPKDDIKFYQSRLKKIESHPSSIQSNNNYFQNVFKVIGEPESNECLICYDNIPAASFSILPCSHIYCYECIKGTIDKMQVCSFLLKYSRREGNIQN